VIVRRCHERGTVRGAITLVAFACLSLAARPAACSDGNSSGGTPGAWLSIGALTGSVLPDAGLADYQWATLPRAAWGAQALAGRDAIAAGVRLWRSQTTQQNALPGETLVSNVHLTSFDAIGRVRLWQVLGMDVSGTTSAGWLHIAYDPDRVRIDTGGGTPVEVRFAPIDEWTAGAGMALSRPVARDWRAGIEVDHRMFRMDTAHRNGSTIEYRRETFGDWSARFELAWHYGPR
jgi:hypothetical protein